jgi:uncharacterized protein YndB with AHSA1/START domain
MAPVSASRELLAPAADVWAFVSTAGRLSDWWPGVFAAQDEGDHWEIEGDERAGLTRVADRSSGEAPERMETVAVEKSPPNRLRLRFARSGYDATLDLSATAANRTTATLSIDVVEAHETLAERLEKVVGATSGRPDEEFADSVLARLYDLCQTGASA